MGRGAQWKVLDSVRSSPALLPVALLAATFLAYLPAMHGDFLWDADHANASSLRSLHGLYRIWFELGTTEQYYPLVHTVFWLEGWLWGDAVLGYHVVNVLLHATAAWLAYLVLRSLDVPGAALAAAVFALHPVMVESVAWITELKNTLSAVFYLAAMLVHLRYMERGGARQYLLSTSLFVLGLLSKTTTVTLPPALLLIAWWKNGRLGARRDVAPLVPWFALALGAGTLTAWVERALVGAQGQAFTLTIAQKVLLAGRTCAFYAGKLAWPAELIFIYPHWDVDARVAWQWLYPAGVLVVVAALVVIAWRVPTRVGRAPLAALLFFVGNLFPALGFFNVYAFIFSYVADHFQYLASLGLIALAASGLALLVRRIPAGARWLGHGACVLLLVALGVLTWRQSGLYEDAHVLYRKTIERNPSCWMALNNLGQLLLEEGKAEEAIEVLERAVRVPGPKRSHEHFNLARALVAAGRQDDAILHYREVLALRPDYPGLDVELSEAHDQRGVQLMSQGRIDEAIAQFRAAASVDASNASARCDLGVALLRAGMAGEAADQFEAALRIAPDYPEALNNLAWVLATDSQRCDPPRAITLAERAVALSDPVTPQLLDTLEAARAATCR